MDPSTDTGAAAYLERAERARMSGDLAAWSVILDEAVVVHPAHAQLRASRSLLFQVTGRRDQAVKEAETALEIDPNDIMIVVILARLLLPQSKERAIELFARVPEGSPYYGEAQRHILTSAEATRSDQARRNLEIHLRAGNGDWRDWYELSRAEYGPAGYERSIEILEEGIRLSDDPTLRMHRALTFAKLARSRTEIEAAQASSFHHLQILREGKYRIPRLTRDVNRTAFHHFYHHGNVAPLQKAIAEACIAVRPDLLWVSPRASTPMTRRIPRVGFISMNYGRHVVGRSLAALLSRVDATQVEAIALYMGASASLNLPVQVVYVPANLSKAREIIAELDLDVLVYADIGVDAPIYYLAFSRLARMQVVYPGHAVTTGLPTIDYYLTFRGWETEGQIDDRYSERAVRLEMPPYFFEPEAFEERPLPAELNRRPIYLCTQAMYKYHPDFDDVIEGIFAADPDARLSLVCRKDTVWWDVLWERWGRRFDLKERVVVLPKLERNQFLSLNATADVVLDTVVYTAGSTAFENYYLGATMVTMPTPYQSGRWTAGLAGMLEVPELVVPDTQSYVATAVRVAHDRSLQENLRGRILVHRDRIAATPQSVRYFLDVIVSLLGQGGH